ncbi:MAG: glycosyltransferase family 2 protein [Chloroflexota bacterium]|nr:glycosyltransferase family 2 protein [Chloroflexota bacterium]
MTTELSFFLPLYNEEANVRAVAGQAVAALERSGLNWELILVDDGSTDATAARAEELCRNPGVRLESHASNRGYGAALKTGFGAARGDLVGFCDGDGQFDPADVGKLLALIEGNDMVIGFRRQRAEGSSRALPSRAWAALAGALLGFSPRDLDCGFKLFRAGFVRSLDLESEGGFISAEIMAKASKLGARIAEVGLEHYPRRAGSQTGLNPLVVARAFWDLLRLYGRLRSWPR